MFLRFLPASWLVHAASFLKDQVTMSPIPPAQDNSSPYRITFAPANAHNYGSRGGTPVDMIVIHSPESSLRSMTTWFGMEAAGASAHYGVGIGQEVVEYVDPSFCAWHAGNAYYNRRSVGIEVEAVSITDTIPDFLPPQIDALVWLCDKLCRQFKIPRDRKFIIGHNEVPNPNVPGKFGGIHGHTDPGDKFPWDDFMARLKAAGEAVRIA